MLSMPYYALRKYKKKKTNCLIIVAPKTVPRTLAVVVTKRCLRVLKTAGFLTMRNTNVRTQICRRLI
jgi:hypothetical protein